MTPSPGAENASSAVLMRSILNHGTDKDGRPEAVILSLDDLAAIEETLDVLATPGLPAQLDAAAAEIDNGNWVGEQELAARYLPHQRQ